MKKHILWVEIAALLVLGMSPLVDAREQHEPNRHNVKVVSHVQGIKQLPKGHQLVRYAGSNYYVAGNQWYRPQAGRYVLITPPVGLRVNALPGKARIVKVGREHYYQVAGVFYQRIGKSHQYQVVRAPSGPAVAWVR